MSDPRWEAGPRVHLGTLRKGTRFMASTGAEYVHDGFHESHGENVVKAKCESCSSDGDHVSHCFAARAEVVVVEVAR